MPLRLATASPQTFSEDQSQCVGAHYGLTPRLYQSGETMRVGRVSKCGDTMMRAALYEAALVLLTGPRVRWSSLKVWGLAVAKRRGMQNTRSRRPHRDLLHAGGARCYVMLIRKLQAAVAASVDQRKSFSSRHMPRKLERRFCRARGLDGSAHSL
jgi:hypothetical protein